MLATAAADHQDTHRRPPELVKPALPRQYDHGHDHGHIEVAAMTKTMKASECKAKFLAVLDEVAATGEPVTVTKNGKPVGQIVPLREKPKTLYGALKGSFTIIGDIVSPMEPDWDEDREWKIITGQPYDDGSSGHPRHPVADAKRKRSGTKGEGGVRRSIRTG
jgi:prevent-host-death family protein